MMDSTDEVQPSSSSNDRRRRFSFWDFLSPGRTTNIRSHHRRKSPSLYVPKGSQINIQIPAIRINSIEGNAAATNNSNSISPPNSSSHNSTPFSYPLPNPNIVIIQSPDSDDQTNSEEGHSKAKTNNDKTDSSITTTSGRSAGTGVGGAYNLLTGFDLDAKVVEVTSETTYDGQAQLLEVVTSETRQRSSSCSQIDGQQFDRSKFRKLSMINVSSDGVVVEDGVERARQLAICDEISESSYDAHQHDTTTMSDEVDDSYSQDIDNDNSFADESDDGMLLDSVGSGTRQNLPGRRNQSKNNNSDTEVGESSDRDGETEGFQKVSLLTEDSYYDKDNRILAGSVEASSLSYSRAKFIAKNRPRLLSHPIMTHSNSFLRPDADIQTAPILPSNNETNNLSGLLQQQIRRVSLTPSSKRLFFMPSYLMRRASNLSSSGLILTDSMVSLNNRALISFIAEENFAGLQHLLDSKRVVVDDRDENGTTALMVAAQRGRVQFVRALLEHGADINAEDSDNWTPLLFATKEGHDDIVADLLEHGSTVDHRDMGGWTPLIWACYKGRTKTAHMLIEKGADVNAYGNYNVTCLGWAAGRNQIEIVKDLIEHGAKINNGDKYGTTPLIWASRKGYIEIVDILLNHEAIVDACGMTSWTALLVATAGNHVEVVKALLEHKPNLNALDKDGCSALTISCKEGFHEIAIALINAGAYININDRSGSSNLIHASKGGHRTIVDALLKKHADVNVQGKDRKTALYWSVEKSHVAVVKLLLTANPDLELATKDGDTPLLRTTRNRNAEIVSLLLEKRAKVNATDKSGDTCLHIAMRSRSKQIVELFLRNPVNSQLLYRPNRSGETPYNIDRSSAKPIITQLFGSRGLNTQEDFENLLGYNLYSSALADMLSDPTLTMPITVGLFARWGSGKSFLLAKLKEEMKSFARQWHNPLFAWSPLLFVIIFCVASVIGVVAGLSLRNWIVGLGCGVGVVLLVHTFLFIVWFCSQRSKYDWSWSHKLTSYLATKIDAARLVFFVVFCHPPGSSASDTVQALPINFYFTEQTKISSTTGGENSVIQMLGSLYACLENDYGTFSTRLFRAFRPKPVNAQTPWKWRKLCCIPYCIIFLLCFFSTLLGTVVLCVYLTDMKNGLNETTLQVLMYGCALFVGLIFVANLYTVGQILKAIAFSHRRHLQRTVNKMYQVKAEGYLYALKSEVNLMTDMVQCLDAFTNRQSRMVVIVDGLDSGEQDKVIQVLDAVHILFSDNKAPFIILLAIDPHIISKGIELNINPVLNDSNVGGQDYLRNLVHLPFYLQNAALRKVKQVKMLEQQMKRKVDEEPGPQITLSTRRPSVESSFGVSLALDRYDKVSSKKTKRLGLKMSDSVASSLGANINKGTGPGDLKKMLLGDDYFSDVNPRSMRRLMNIIHITGRLLKAFNFDFNWHHLSTWVNVTEQWPYRLSWMILYCELFQKELDDSLSLKAVFERVKPFVPVSKEVDPSLALDRDEKKLDVYLGLHKSSLLVSTMYIFLPFTISLDPQLRKDIQEQYQPLEQIFKQTPGNLKPAIQAPPSPYMNPSFQQNLRYRQSGRQQASMPQSTTALQPYYQHMVASNPLSSYSNMWPYQNPNLPPPPQFIASPVATDSILARELRSVKLGQLNVEGVVELLGSLPSLKSVSVGKYQEEVRKNNITGRVLLLCDMAELKEVLCMTFGDWELFKSAICILRENATLAEASNRLDGSTESYVQINVTSPDKDRPGSGMMGNASVPENQENRKILKPNVLEKQITMEDQMITGALELLNDEAKADARKGEESLSNSTLSPIHSEPEPLESRRRSSKAVTDKNETDVLYVLGTSMNVTAELPDSPTVLRNLENIDKSQYAIVNESRGGRNSITLNNSDQIVQSMPSQYQQQQVYQSTSHLDSPGKKRGSIKRAPGISRHQSAAGSISTALTNQLRKKDQEKSRVPKTPEVMHQDDRKKSTRRSNQNFRIGGESSSDVSSDESQKPLMNRNAVSVQARKSVGSRTPRAEHQQHPPSPPKKRVQKEETATGSSRLSRIKTSIFGQPKEGEPSSQGGYMRDPRSSGGSAAGGLLMGKRSSRDDRYVESYITEDSSEPAMYYNQDRGKPWTQYRAPTPLPPFGSEEYYRVIKSSNPSPTTSNESEIGSSPEEISSGENLFFPEPPELSPESPFPRRIGLSSVAGSNLPNVGNYFTGNTFVPYPYHNNNNQQLNQSAHGQQQQDGRRNTTSVEQSTSQGAFAAATALSVALNPNKSKNNDRSSQKSSIASATNQPHHHDFHNQFVDPSELVSQIINLDVIRSSFTNNSSSNSNDVNPDNSVPDNSGPSPQPPSLGRHNSGRGSRVHGRSIVSSGEENKCQFNSNQIGKTKTHFNLSDPVLSSRSNLATSVTITNVSFLGGIEQQQQQPIRPTTLARAPQRPSNLQERQEDRVVLEEGDEESHGGGQSLFQDSPLSSNLNHRKFSQSQAQSQSPISLPDYSGQYQMETTSQQSQSQRQITEEEQSQTTVPRGQRSNFRRQGEFDVPSSRDGTPTKK